MVAVIGGIISWLTGGFLNRALKSVDRYVDAKTDRERIKADVVTAYYSNRAAWMQAGGFWLLLMLAIPTAFHYAAVVLYSVFWCLDCAFPKTWTIAALPGVLAEYQGWVILACVGGAGAFAWKK